MDTLSLYSFIKVHVKGVSNWERYLKCLVYENCIEICENCTQFLLK